MLRSFGTIVGYSNLPPTHGNLSPAPSKYFPPHAIPSNLHPFLSPPPLLSLCNVPGISLPRPWALAEICRGSIRGGTTTTATTVTNTNDISHHTHDDRDGDEGGGGGGSRGVRLARDFDFREAFVVHEDRDLLACSPLREVICIRWNEEK